MLLTSPVDNSWVWKVIFIVVRLVLIFFLSSTFRTRHEALQKLAIFFQHSKDEFGDIPDSGGATPTKYSSLLRITSYTTILEIILFISLKICQWYKKLFLKLTARLFFYFIHFYPMKSADPPSKFALLSPLMSLIMVKLRGGCLWISLKTQQSQHWRLACNGK